MSLFQTSNISFGSAKQYIGNVAGIASSDSAMLTRCGQALVATIHEWNTFEAWNYMRTVAPNISVVASTGTYALPFDLTAIYDARLLSDGRRLQFLNRRTYDTIKYDQTASDAPIAYDLFRHGTEGKIELFPTPNATDTLVLKYYRRMSSPCSVTVANCTATGAALATTSSTGFDGVTLNSPVSGTGITAGTVVQSVTDKSNLTLSAVATSSNVSITFGGDTVLLDVPADWQWFIISGARHRFLNDKGTHLDRVPYWMQDEQKGLAMAKAKNVRVPDEELAFLPSDVDAGPIWNPNSVGPWLTDW